MKNHNNRDKDIKETVERFEGFLNEDSPFFLDVSAFDEITGYYLENNLLDKALQAIEIGLEQHPYSSELMLAKAKTVYFSSDYKKALELVEKIETYQPNDAEALSLKGSIYNALGRFHESLECLAKAIEWADDKNEVLLTMGKAHKALGDYTAAAKIFKEIILLEPSFEEAMHELSFCADRLKQTDQFGAFLEQQIDERPYSVHCWYNLGVFYNRTGKFEDALMAFDYCNVIDADFSPAYYFSANVNLNLNKHQEAFDCFQKTLELEGESAEVLIGMGSSKEKLEQYEEAIKHYTKAIEHDNYFEDAWMGVGICLSELGKWMEALHFLKKAIEINPSNPVVWLEIAQIEYQLGNMASCQEAFQQVMGLDAGEVELWLNWSYVEYENGNIETAINLIEEGIEENPDDPELLYRACAYCFSGGQYKKGCEYLELALSLDYDGHTVLYDFFLELEKQKVLAKIIAQYNS